MSGGNHACGRQLAGAERRLDRQRRAIAPLSLSMQQVLGYSALETGLAQLPLAGTLVLAAGVVSPLVTRLRSKPVTLAGLVTFAPGLALFSRMPADADFVADLLGPSLLVGVGLAATFVSLTVSAVEGSPNRNPVSPQG